MFLDHGSRDFGYCVFGRVADQASLDVVDAIARSETTGKGTCSMHAHARACTHARGARRIHSLVHAVGLHSLLCASLVCRV